LVIGGTSGVGLAAARRARAAGADVIVTARNADRLHRVGLELAASIAAFDATDYGRLARFFDALAAPVDHVLLMVSNAARPALPELHPEAGAGEVDPLLFLPVEVSRIATPMIRPGGSLLFLRCTGGRATLTANLGFVRVCLIAGGLEAEAAEVAELALRLMTNRAVTGTPLEAAP
jgi:NAD(P)-dependent dehydrogenase (short-subunit alcohol dehydrogenase family)